MPSDDERRKKYEHLEQIAIAYRSLNGECSRCRNELQPDWQFCAHCEARLATECPGCGVPLPPAGASHCGHCGMVLAGATS
jgi:predicted amidophosphoribosyltransferase